MKLKWFKYDGNTVYIIPGIRFTGDIARDVARMEEDEDIDEWLWGELQTDEGITDSARRIIYWGADVQDHISHPTDVSYAALGSRLRGSGVKDVYNIDELAAMFDLPSWEEVEEANGDYVFDAGRYAVQNAMEDVSADGDDDDERGLDEEDFEEERDKAEGEAQDEIYGQWYAGVESAAEKLFEVHKLELDPVSAKGSIKYAYEFKIKPEEPGQKGWREAAAELLDTLNGVGYFTFSGLDEWLSTGPYTPRQAVLTHLGYIKDYPEVYGAHSARQYYDWAWR